MLALVAIYVFLIIVLRRRARRNRETTEHHDAVPSVQELRSAELTGTNSLPAGSRQIRSPAARVDRDIPGPSFAPGIRSRRRDGEGQGPVVPHELKPSNPVSRQQQETTPEDFKEHDPASGRFRNQAAVPRRARDLGNNIADRPSHQVPRETNHERARGMPRHSPVEPRSATDQRWRTRVPEGISEQPRRRPGMRTERGIVNTEQTPMPARKSAARDGSPDLATDELPTKPALSPSEIERYSRHIILREIGGIGQARLKNGRVLVVGAGGLGSPALLYLNAAGVGQIGIADDDEVAISNLQRQIIHDSERVGSAKVYSALVAMSRQNPSTRIKPYELRLGKEEAQQIVPQYGLVLDGSDNFETRQIVNQACVENKVPLVYAAITQWEGQVGVYLPNAGVPCYACLFDKMPAPETVPSCAEAGVLGALPGVLGSIMAVEAIKVMAMAGKTLAGRLVIYDALDCEFTTIRVGKNPACPVCRRNKEEV